MPVTGEVSLADELAAKSTELRRLTALVLRRASGVVVNGQYTRQIVINACGVPELKVSASELVAWRERLGLSPDGRPVVALAPGAVGPSKRWPIAYYADLARQLGAEGLRTWVIGGPGERDLALQILEADPRHTSDLTGPDLRNAILALAAATAAVSNDSGLLHVAAALGTPAIGIFGPTSPWHWAPLNPIAAVIETSGELPCRPCHKPVCRLGHHRCMRDIAVDRVAVAARQAVAAVAARPAV